jgi:hypothetical protein
VAQEIDSMDASKTPRQALAMSRRNALRMPAAALLAATLGPALLAACGGGGDSAPTGGGTATPQSLMIGPIGGLGSIIVNGVRFEDNSARVEDEDGASQDRSALKLGMMVEVESSAIDDNTGRATAAVIRFGSEIKGPVASIDSSAQTLRVLDQTVEIRPETVFDPRLVGGFSALAVGQILEIHALFDGATSRYLATRIELEDSASNYRLRGLVSALDPVGKTFNIGAAVISYAGVPAGELPPLANGQRVRVRLQTTQVNGQWVAISVRSGVRRVEDISDARIRGFVTAYTSATQFSVEGIAVDATNARFEPGPGAVQLGALVEVRGRASGGTIIASRVKAIDRLGDDWRRVELHGSMSALDTDAKTFMLREVKVNYSRVIEWRNGGEADLANNKLVEVKGLWSEDRSVLFAARIAFE